MSKTRYTAKFRRPDGRIIRLTRHYRDDYGYRRAWCLLDGGGDIIDMGLSRTHADAETMLQAALKYDPSRIALFAPVKVRGVA
jgi:hypothetical protein